MEEEKAVRVITRTHNLYDQMGDCLVAIFFTLPSLQQLSNLLLEDCCLAEKDIPRIADRLRAGGGRMGAEEVWYNMKTLKEGELYE